MKATIALSAAGILAVGAATVSVAPPAAADGPERHLHGHLAGARYDIDVDKDHHRFEVEVDLAPVPAGSTWKLVVRHDGKRVAVRKARAVQDDGRYEVEFRDVHSADTPGSDKLKVKIVHRDGPGKVTRTLRFKR